VPNLKLKIPPLILVVISAVLMWITSLWLPDIQVPSALSAAIFYVLAITGAIFTISGVVSFKKAKTTVNPTTPNDASALVTNGIYKVTRNPMYVGFLFFLIGWGIFLSNLYALALIVGFVLYMNRYQIKPEEEALESVFGSEFLTYKNRVRRWL
jgi:protein-S-isoprenylcysteine O-methyltransferase Ste14